MLSAWATFQRECNGAEVVIDPSLKSPYAFDCGLLGGIAGRLSPGRFSRTEQWLTPRRVARAAEIDALLTAAGPVLHLEGDARDAIRYCLSELLRNVFEHSASPIGAFIAAGHFRKTGRLTIAVVDMGLTIPKHLRAQQGAELSDERALSHALEPVISGSTILLETQDLGSS